MKRPLVIAILATAALVPRAAPAQIVTECSWIASPVNIAEPWEENSRSYANGAVRIAVLDTGEPACCAAHLLVLMPAGGGDEGPQYRACFVISAAPGSGFYALDMAGVASRYDPAEGLLIDLPVAHWTPAVEQGRAPLWERLEFVVDQARGTVSVP